MRRFRLQHRPVLGVLLLAVAAASAGCTGAAGHAPTHSSAAVAATTTPASRPSPSPSTPGSSASVPPISVLALLPPPTHPSTQPLTRKLFVGRAVSVCTTYKQLSDAMPAATSLQGVPKVLHDRLVMHGRMLTDIRALAAKQPDLADLESHWLTPSAALDASVAQTAGAMQQALAKGDQQTAQKLVDQLQSDTGVDDSVLQWLVNYGLTACAKLESNDS